MIYRLKELKGDTIPVPQLIFSKLGIAEEYNVRVALYVLATGVTDPEKICADLKLRSRISAESALSFWAGAGLLERYDENAAPGAEPSAPAPMTWAEIAAASRTDPMISSLIDCAQTGFARPLTHSEMEKLVNLYVQEGFAPETVMLCVAYVASRGKRTMAAVLHELKVWRAEGVETGEQADAHLKLLALRQTREQYVASLLGIPDSELTLGGRKAIARWYEVYGYDDAMVQGKGAGAALRAYRKAQKLCASTPDIAYMPQVCLRVAQYETQYISRKKALAQLAEAKQGFLVRKKEGDETAQSWLDETEAVIRQLLERE